METKGVRGVARMVIDVRTGKAVRAYRSGQIIDKSALFRSGTVQLLPSNASRTSTQTARERAPVAVIPDATQLAVQEFARRIGQLPGVLRVEEYEANPASPARRFLVVVPTLNSRVSEQVLELKNDIMDQHAGARLEVRLKGVQERGLGPDDAHRVS